MRKAEKYHSALLKTARADCLVGVAAVVADNFTCAGRARMVAFHPESAWPDQFLVGVMEWVSLFKNCCAEGHANTRTGRLVAKEF